MALGNTQEERSYGKCHRDKTATEGDGFIPDAVRVKG